MKPAPQTVFKIRHKITGQWRYKGLGGYFTENFFSAADYGQAHKALAMINKNKKYYEARIDLNEYCRKIALDIPNWEIVEYIVSAVEVK